jgi:hypothetical protein
VKSALDIVKFLKPKPCPFPMVRIGGKYDGAYLVPDDLNGIAACFSPGTANRKDFEDELLDSYGIGSHMCDKSGEPEQFRTPLRPEQTFRKKWLGITNDGDNITLPSWVAAEVPGKSDLMLQMDIEGAEYQTILATTSDTLIRFRIIVVELHALGRLNRAMGVRLLLPFFERLAMHHRCVHLHPNNVKTQVKIRNSDYWIPRILEVTLIRKDRIAGESTFIPPQMPHPLDIEYNVKGKQLQTMGRNWSR